MAVGDNRMKANGDNGITGNNHVRGMETKSDAELSPTSDKCNLKRVHSMTRGQSWHYSSSRASDRHPDTCFYLDCTNIDKQNIGMRNSGSFS